MAETSKYKFYLPQGNEQFDITHTNDNFMKTDKAIFANTPKAIICSSPLGLDTKIITIPEYEVKNDCDIIYISFTEGVNYSGSPIKIKDITSDEEWELQLPSTRGGFLLHANTFYTFCLNNTNGTCTILSFTNGMRNDLNTKSVIDYLATFNEKTQNWIPEITGKSAGASFIKQEGKYRRIGASVYCSFDLEFNASGFFDNINADFKINNLPFPLLKGGICQGDINKTIMAGMPKVLGFIKASGTDDYIINIHLYENDTNGLHLMTNMDVSKFESGGNVKLSGDFNYITI